MWRAPQQPPGSREKMLREETRNKKITLEGPLRNSITVQGVGSPVPAVLGSEQAGSRPSTSRDRNATVVANLATVTDNATSSTMEQELAFARNRKTMRSPVRPQMHAAKEIEIFGTPTTYSANVDETQSQINVCSPSQEFIGKMRAEEEAAILNIKKTLSKMKAAIQKQKNINMDVKDGVQEIDELVCIAETCRANWLRTERDRRTKEANKAPMNSEEGAETPVTGGSKRTASSPAEEPTISKKVKQKDVGKWQTVFHRKKPIQNNNTEGIPEQHECQEEHQRPLSKEERKMKEKSRAPKAKAEAIIINPREGHSYAEVLKTLRNSKETEKTKKVKAIRKTRAGALLLELEKGEHASPEFLKELQQEVKDILKESADIRSVAPKTTIEIRDLDALTTPEEVEQSIRSLMEIGTESMVIRITKPNSRELVRAFVTLSQERAKDLLQIGSIKVGWCRVKLRKYENVKRCFKCFGTGHEQWNCTGPDRKNQGLCIRCGEAGHIMKVCKNEAKCCLCTEAGHSQRNHLPGTSKCRMTSRGPK